MTLPRLLAVVSFVILASSSVEAAGKVEFNRDIRPILSENCFHCHGPDKTTRKARLRLDERESAVNRKAIVPGKPDESELIARILSSEENEVMPPPKAHKTLTAPQKALLRQWIQEGAVYQAHWAYLTPQRPPIPTVQRVDQVRTPVDAFLLYTLEARKIRPSPPADKRTLVRRLYLDLLGLPPTAREVEDFVQDRDPKAYEKLVDRLLESPHYGERMAVPWLDLVRFADTVGYHGDQNQNVFPYRDYVIDAFNKNKPFDQFTIEQLAGDLLPNPTIEQRVASGFNRLNMMTREGGAQPKEYLAKYAADRVRTVSMTWMGSTMGCCECHDHKYDPFTAKDFYSLAAFFADLRQWGVYNDYSYTPNPDLRGWSNDHPFPPEIEVFSPYLGQRSERLGRLLGQLEENYRDSLKKDAKAQAGLLDWLEASRSVLDGAVTGWSQPPVVLQSGNGEVQADRSLLLTGGEKNPKASRKAPSGEYVVRLQPTAGWLAALRLELLPHAAHKGRIVRGATDSTTVQVSVSLKPASGGRETRLAFWHADADLQEPRYSSSAPILGVKDAWKTSGRHVRLQQTAVYLLDKPVALKPGDELVVTVRSDGAGCVRLACSPFALLGTNAQQLLDRVRKALLRPAEERTPEQQTVLAGLYLQSTAADAPRLARYRAIQREQFECRAGRTTSQVSVAVSKPPVCRVLPRGNWMDESGAEVVPAVPHFLPQPPNATGRRLNRLDLARWLVAPENPLTARVFANRLWKQFFGTGISSVMEDVGAQGEWPVHPELLDWLAVEFRESGWNVKHLVRLIVLSSAYQQDSKARQDLRDADPTNRLIAAQSPRRLEAEFVRDNALTIAGLLCRDVGGPSVRPYQPADYYANLQFPDRDYVAHPDERQYRRGVYMHWQRTFLHPMLANFDAPSREECTASRIVANTPQQALTLLNDPSFVEAARVFAQKTLTAPAASDAERIQILYRTALARSATEREVAALTNLLNSQRELYRGQPADAAKLLRVGQAPLPAQAEFPELAAWTSVCRVILNLHETITRY